MEEEWEGLRFCHQCKPSDVAKLLVPGSGGLFGLNRGPNHSHTHTHTRLPESSAHGLSDKGLLADEDSVVGTNSSLNSLNRYSLTDTDKDIDTMETGTNSDHLSLPMGGSLSSMDGTEGLLGFIHSLFLIHPLTLSNPIHLLSSIHLVEMAPKVGWFFTFSVF